VSLTGCADQLEASRLIVPPTPLGATRQGDRARSVGKDAMFELSGGEQPLSIIESLLRRCPGKTALAQLVLEKFEKQAAGLSPCSRPASGPACGQLARVAHSLKDCRGRAADTLRQLRPGGRIRVWPGILHWSTRHSPACARRIQRCAKYAAGKRSLSNVQKEPSDARVDCR